MSRRVGTLVVSAVAGVLAASGIFLPPPPEPAASAEFPDPVARFLRADGARRTYEFDLPAGWALRGVSCTCVSLEDSPGNPARIVATVDCDRKPAFVSPGVHVHRPDGERRLVELPCP